MEAKKRTNTRYLATFCKVLRYCYFLQGLAILLERETHPRKRSFTPQGDQPSIQLPLHAASKSDLKPTNPVQREVHTNAQSDSDDLLSPQFYFRILVHLKTNLSHAKNRPATHLPRHPCKYCNG